MASISANTFEVVGRHENLFRLRQRGGKQREFMLALNTRGPLLYPAYFDFVELDPRHRARRIAWAAVQATLTTTRQPRATRP